MHKTNVNTAMTLQEYFLFFSIFEFYKGETIAFIYYAPPQYNVAYFSKVTAIRAMKIVKFENKLLGRHL